MKVVKMKLRKDRPVNKVENISEKHAMSLGQGEVSSSGILEVIAEVEKQMRHEYMDVPPPTDTHRPYLERELSEKALSRILDRAISLDGVKGESSMDYETLIESLRPYATSIQTKEYSFETVSYIRLQKISMIVNASDSRVRIVNDIRLTIHSFGDTSYMKAVLLLDAAMDAVQEMVQRLMLEIKAMLNAQDIYLKYAGVVADTMTSQYHGQTRVSHKGNRTTLHFYLSDTEKAVISFFQKKMPWTLPDPPTDPESLRNACQEDGAPYFIVPLSKYDRRRLKS